jgi:alkanesulfonate monooxygenase SsuD/methylene tetrahydromethanopterin reductase-like flavin-dependent oxidoreductase (luciferase family)
MDVQVPPRVGIFVDLRNPSPWRRPWANHYRLTLERIVEAESLGAQSVWMTEHHGFDDGYLPQPLTFAAAVAAVTTRIRIGTAVLIAPYRSALHIAEEAAIVDLVSNGRLELGLGAGYVQSEFEAFGADFDRRYQATETCARELRQLFAEGSVHPPPTQHPIPLWLGYRGQRNARRAGRLGLGILSVDRSSAEPYLEGLVEGGHDPSTARMAGVLDILVADDPERARTQVLPHYLHLVNSYRAAKGTSNQAPPPPLALDDLRDPRAVEDIANLSVRLEVLTPDQAVTEIRRRTEGMPVKHIYLWMSIAGMPDEMVERHLELLFTKVVPALSGPPSPGVSTS